MARRGRERALPEPTELPELDVRPGRRLGPAAAASSASRIAAIAPARSPSSSLAYEMRAYDGADGLSATMRSKVAKASS